MSSFPNLRAIFASSRSSEDERRLSKSTFLKFVGFGVSCAVISIIAHSRASRSLA